MFSRLETIFRNNFLPIRESDPHPGLNRENKGSASKKNKGNNEKLDENHSDFDEDTTTVSVLALQTFLNDLTHAPDIKHDFADGINSHEESKNNQISNAKTERAIQAYKHMASESNTPPPPQKVEGRIDRMLYHLNDDEKKMVATLITELQILHGRGIHKLSIKNDTSFFTGIIDAITNEKQRLD